jgi:hypothetical protein
LRITSQAADEGAVFWAAAAAGAGWLCGETGATCPANGAAVKIATAKVQTRIKIPSTRNSIGATAVRPPLSP